MSITYNAYSCYKIRQEIGVGGFARVYHATHRETGEEFAMKMIDKKTMKEKGMNDRVRNEIMIQTQLDHPSILTLHTSFEDADYVYLVLEYCSRGDLQCYLKNRKRSEKLSNKDKEEARAFVQQIVEGMLYLHGRGVIHRDLKVANLLLDDDKNIKIADFGLATALHDRAEKHYTMCGTPNYIAPEIANRDAHGLKSDVWSLGCVLYTILVGKPPFDANEIEDVMGRVVVRDLLIPHFVSPHAADLIDRLLKLEPDERIKLYEVLDHPFMNDSELTSNRSRGHSSVDSGHNTMSTEHSTTTTNSSPVYSPPASGGGRRGLKSRLQSHKRPMMARHFDVSSNTDDGYFAASMEAAAPQHRRGQRGTGVTYTVDSFQQHQQQQHKTKEETRASLANDMPGNRPIWHQQRPRMNPLPPKPTSYDFVTDRRRLDFDQLESTRASSSSGRRYEPGSYKPTDHWTDEDKENIQDDEEEEISSILQNEIRRCVLATNIDPSDDHSARGRSLSRRRYPYNFPDDPKSSRSKSESQDSLMKVADADEERRLRSRRGRSTRRPLEETTLNRNRSEPNLLSGEEDSGVVHRRNSLREKISTRPLLPLVTSLTRNTSGRNDQLVRSNSSRGDDRRRHCANSSSSTTQQLRQINTARLQPIRQRTKNAMVTILSNGWTCLEIIKNINSVETVFEVILVSSDGEYIKIFKPSSGCPIGDAPPPTPRHALSHHMSSLPQKYFNKYMYLEKFVELAKSKTPKITYFSNQAKCVLMENEDSFEFTFYNGAKIARSKGGKTEVTDANGTKFSVDSDVLCEEFDDVTDPRHLMMSELSDMIVHGREIAKDLLLLNKQLPTFCRLASPFPLRIGKRPSPSPSSTTTKVETSKQVAAAAAGCSTPTTRRRPPLAEMTPRTPEHLHDEDDTTIWKTQQNTISPNQPLRFGDSLLSYRSCTNTPRNKSAAASRIMTQQQLKDPAPVTTSNGAAAAELVTDESKVAKKVEVGGVGVVHLLKHANNVGQIWVKYQDGTQILVDGNKIFPVFFRFADGERVEYDRLVKVPHFVKEKIDGLASLTNKALTSSPASTN